VELGKQIYSGKYLLKSKSANSLKHTRNNSNLPRDQESSRKDFYENLRVKRI